MAPPAKSDNMQSFHEPPAPEGPARPSGIAGGSCILRVMPELSDEEYARYLALTADPPGDGDAAVIVNEAPTADEVAAAADAQVAVIDAAAEAEAKVIAARADAEVAVMTAAAEIRQAEEAADTDEDTDDDTMFDSDGNARPESQHWFWRPLGGKGR